MKSHTFSILSLASAASALLFPPPPLPECHDAHPLVPTAVVYPLYISTYIDAATVFNINGDANITINNAPTVFETLTQGTSTIFSPVATTTTTVTTSSTSSTISPSATVGPPSIIEPIRIFFFRPGAKKRQVPADLFLYLKSDGTVTGDESSATIFNLVDNRLESPTGSEFTTDPTTGDALFAPGAGGSIDQTFTIDSGILNWTNGNFTISPTHQAQFGARFGSSTSLIAAFKSFPADAVAVVLSATLASAPTSTVSSASSTSSFITNTDSASSTATGTTAIPLFFNSSSIATAVPVTLKL